MSWKKFEDDNSQEIQGPSHHPRKWYYFANPVTTPKVIKNLEVNDPSETLVHIYTDGSCKGWESTTDQRAISGWGCFMQVETKGAATKDISYSGGILNADAQTAELLAVIESLIRIKAPCKIHLHSDSQYVITAMQDLPAFIRDRRAAIEAIPANERYRPTRYEQQRLALWERLQQEVQKPNIQQITIQWIKGHQVADLANAHNKKDAEAARDIHGNDMADKLSNIGAIKCVVEACHDLERKSRINSEKASLHINILKKNLQSSFFARETAVMYLVEKPNLLTQDIISKILDADSISRIQRALSQGVAIAPKHPQLNYSLSSVNAASATKGKDSGSPYSPST